MNEHCGRAKVRWAGWLALACAAAGGCGDAFRGWDCMDFEVAPDRLRQIRRIDLEAASAGGPEPATAPATRATTAPAATQPAASQPVRRLEIPLERCRALALANNLDLKVELLNPTIAAQGITEAEAQFEALLYANAGYAKTDTPTASQLSGSQIESLSVTPGVRLPVRTGGTAAVEVPMNSVETNNAFSTLDPAHDADLRLTFTQPLLRGGGWRTNTYAIRVARWQHQQSQALAKLEVIRVLAAVDRVYWRLYAARQEREVRRQELALAESQLERARRQVAAGAKPEVEIVRAQLGVAERREAIILAGNEVRRQQRDLKRILQKPELTMGGPTTLVPATPPGVTRYRLQADKLIELAMDNRMELLQLELQLAQDASTVDFERNGTLPLVTLGYTYNVNGLGGTRCDAFDLMFQRRFEDHQLGLQVEIPLGNQAARSRLRRAILTRVQRLATRERRKRLVEQEVLDSLDQLEANWERILASRKRIAVAERVLQAEQRQFDQGLRTSTEVLDAQTRLADAQSSLVRALAEYQIAQVDLAFATGTVLGAARVRWEPIVPAEIRGE
jgi:outer membrane protein